MTPRRATRGAAPSERAVLATAALGTMLMPLNSTMIAVALPDIVADLDVSLASTAWLVSGYLIAQAALQPLAGKLGDRLGRRALILGGLSSFALVALGTARSPSAATPAPGLSSSRPPGPRRAPPARCTHSASASPPVAASRSPRSSSRAKIATICWHMLTRGEDYGFARPSLTRAKLRRLERLAGAAPGTVINARHQRRHVDRERELQRQAEAGYRRWLATGTRQRRVRS